MKRQAFDLETKGKSYKDALKFKPEFEAPGNIKDPAKIAEAIAKKERDWLDSLALSATTAEIVIAGFQDIDSGEIVRIEGDEKDIIEKTWDLMFPREAPVPTFGHYLHSFDLKMLIRRSWALGIKPPGFLLGGERTWYGQGMYDTAVMWGLGGYGGDDKYISLDTLAKHLGVGEKNGDGAHFWEVYQKDKTAAYKYFDNDLSLVSGCVKKMV